MSRVFRLVVGARTRLYDAGLLRVRRLDHPVISVGNLTTGGTGKTPLVIELAEQFRKLGHRPVILSRGYRRRSRGVVVVSRGAGPEVGWADAGDEPYLMALRLPGVAVVVGASRYEAGRAAEARNLGDLFILDDGFQHRQLHRDVDLVTIDPAEWTGPERLLPAGPWREPRAALRRADAACVRASADAPPLALPVPSFPVETVVEGLVRDGALVPPGTLQDRAVVAFAGIAKPERFFRTLEELGIRPAATRIFPDHHRYRPQDLADLPPGERVTTEKDAVRLPPGGFYFLRVSAKIQRFESLRDLILQRIATPRAGSS